MRAVDVTGQRFGRLVAVERSVKRRIVSSKSLAITKWRCVCDCGNEVWVTLGNLGRVTNSCGCLRKALLKKTKTKPIEEVVTRQVMNYYKRNAKNRSIGWELTDEQFKCLINSACYYCGVVGGTTTTTKWSRIHDEGRRTWDNNGVDRLDNTKGYTVENSVTACKFCNIAKSTMTQQQFNEWISRVYNHLIQKGGA